MRASARHARGLKSAAGGGQWAVHPPTVTRIGAKIVGLRTCNLATHVLENFKDANKQHVAALSSLSPLKLEAVACPESAKKNA